MGIGDYTLNCHGTEREGSRYEGRHVGEFYKSTAPFQLPYGMVISKTHANLLSPVACSASHVGFSAIRLEPTWAALGQAAGLAAHLAASRGVPVQEVDVEQLQELLNGDGAKTIYVTDVEPGEPEFAAVQYFGVRGAFHGLRNPAEQDPPQAELIYGQYIKARPWHEAELEKPITPPLARRWLALVPSGVSVPDEMSPDRTTDLSVTRGAFLRRLYETVPGKNHKE
ncbi:MAG: FAD-dependent oxidoreductase [Opitutales bacterium]